MGKLILASFFLVSFFNVSGQYCMTGGPSSTADSNVESVSIIGESSSISYTGCPGVIGIEEHLTETADLNAGGTYAVAVQFGTCGGNYSGVGEAWIDFNSNNVFEPSESILTWSGTPPTIVQNVVFNVPAGAINGLTRMRIIQAEGQTLPLDPCASFTWGSVTDFNIQIMNGVDCSLYVGDDMSDPREVTAIPFSETYDNSICYSNQNLVYSSPDVFYKVGIPTGMSSITASLCGSTFDTYLTVMNQQGTIIGFNDDNCGSQSEVTVSTDGIDTILVVVEGWGTEMGSYTLTISEGDLGIDQIEYDPFQLSPNPANDILSITGGFTGTATIINTAGQSMMQSELHKNETLDISSLPAGFYLVQLTTATRTYDKKLIVR